MAQSLRLDGLDLVHVQVQFSCFRRNVLGNFTQLGPAAANNGAGASALWRAVILTKASLIIQFGAAKLERWHVLQWNVLDTSRAGAAGRSSAQFLFFFPQPIAKPGHVAIAVQRVAQNIPVDPIHFKTSPKAINTVPIKTAPTNSRTSKIYLQRSERSQVIKRPRGDARDFILEQRPKKEMGVNRRVPSSRYETKQKNQNIFNTIIFEKRVRLTESAS
jgi:hypothetical protein